MKELNELVELAKEINSKRWFLNADEEVTAIDNHAGPDDSEEAFIRCAANIQLAKYITAASPENILAIAEAFRALEHDLEKECDILIDTAESMRQWKKRAEAAEARLAGLERLKALGWQFEQCENESCDNGAVVNVIGADVHLCAECSRDKKYSRMKINALPKRLTRPAPAINLAELVPDEVLRRLEHEAGHLVHHCHHIDEHSCKVDRRDLLTITEACRVAILRNFEEAK